MSPWPVGWRALSFHVSHSDAVCLFSLPDVSTGGPRGAAAVTQFSEILNTTTDTDTRAVCKARHQKGHYLVAGL